MSWVKSWWAGLCDFFVSPFDFSMSFPDEQGVIHSVVSRDGKDLFEAVDAINLKPMAAYSPLFDQNVVRIPLDETLKLQEGWRVEFEKGFARHEQALFQSFINNPLEYGPGV